MRDREGWHQTMGCGPLVILAEHFQLRDNPGNVSPDTWGPASGSSLLASSQPHFSNA